MRLYTCKICGYKSVYKMLKIAINAKVFPYKDGDQIKKVIDVCDDCVYRVPGLSSEAFLEDLKK